MGFTPQEPAMPSLRSGRKSDRAIRVPFDRVKRQKVLAQFDRQAGLEDEIVWLAGRVKRISFQAD